MYNIRPTTRFQRDLKRVKKRGLDLSLLTVVLQRLAAGEPLPEKNRDHPLPRGPGAEPRRSLSPLFSGEKGAPPEAHSLGGAPTDRF